MGLFHSITGNAVLIHTKRKHPWAGKCLRDSRHGFADWDL